MPIQVHCPGGHTLSVKDKYAGLRGRCPRCGVQIEVPQLMSDADIADVLDADDDQTSVLDDPQLEKHLESSGISLVGSKVFTGPIKRCPKCNVKVHVPANKVCPNCAACFTHW